MVARRRLQNALDFASANGACWRCALFDNGLGGKPPRLRRCSTEPPLASEPSAVRTGRGVKTITTSNTKEKPLKGRNECFSENVKIRITPFHRSFRTVLTPPTFRKTGRQALRHINFLPATRNRNCGNFMPYTAEQRFVLPSLYISPEVINNLVGFLSKAAIKNLQGKLSPDAVRETIRGVIEQINNGDLHKLSARNRGEERLLSDTEHVNSRDDPRSPLAILARLWDDAQAEANTPESSLSIETQKGLTSTPDLAVHLKILLEEALNLSNPKTRSSSLTSLGTQHLQAKHPERRPAFDIKDEKRSTYQLLEIYASRKLFLSSYDNGRRLFSTSSFSNAVLHNQPEATVDGETPLYSSPPFRMDIRDHLRVWQEQLQTNANQGARFQVNGTSPSGTAHNPFSQAREDGTLQTIDEGSEPFAKEPDVDLSSSNDDLEPTNNGAFLRPGDVVELMNNGSPILAVIIKHFEHQSQFYTMHGRWLHGSSRRIIFALPQMILPEEIRSITPYLPTSEVSEERLDRFHALDVSVPRSLGADIINKLLHFYHSTNDITRANASRLNRIHDIVASKKRCLHEMPLKEIAMKVLQLDPSSDVTASMLWAVHRAILKDGRFIVDLRTHRLFPAFDIMSKEEANSMRKVQSWMREYQEGAVNDATEALDSGLSTTNPLGESNPFPKFIAKARRMIKHSREMRMVTLFGTLGPSSVRLQPEGPNRAVWQSSPAVSFHEDELEIIRLLQAWATTDSMKRDMACSSIGPMILRATGFYEGFELGTSTGFVFLQELGVIPPWLNRASFFQKLSLPSHDVNHQVDQLYRQAENSVSEFSREDSMKGLRKDWGNLTVFCIDSSEAYEIDDGVSLEEIEGCTSASWVHIHVANPSAFLKPRSAMGLYAERLTESVYFPERVYTMLPRDITEKHFSLAKNRPCITFSAKLNDVGEILDTQVSHGILRNVVYVTPEMLSRKLGFGEGNGAQEVRMTIGGKMPAKPADLTAPALTAIQTKTLGKLFTIITARRQRKTRQGAIIPQQSIPNPEVKVYLDSGVDALIPNLHNRIGSRYIGDPIISLTTSPFLGEIPTDLSRWLVQDLMLLAGEVGASWCSQRNIPISYRGTLLNPNPPASGEALKREVMDRAIVDSGFVPIDLFMRYVTIFGNKSLSAMPVRHALLGATVYSRVTSPLRRFTDLMAHWQIDAAVRHELRTGSSLIGSTDDSYLPYSRHDVERIVSRVSIREQVILMSRKRALRFWLQQFMTRAYYFKEASIPETFALYIYHGHQVPVLGYVGWMKDLGLPFHLPENQVTKRDGGVRAGDWWEVRLVHIDCYNGTNIVEALRLVERTEL